MEQEIDERLVQQIDQARLLYALHGACLLFSAGAFSLIPFMLNQIRQKNTSGWVRTHHTYMIRAFWIFAAMMLVGALTARFTVGGLIILVGWFLFARKLFLGYRALADNEPAPTKQ